MKILVSLETRVRPDSTGIYFIEAFRKLGHEVDHVLPEKMVEVHGGYDLYVKIDDGQKQTTWNPELHPSAYYCIDTHIETDWRLELARTGRFDAVSVVHSEGLKLPWGRDDVYWNPVGCDPDLHYVGPQAKLYDGCFIGNFHNNLAGPRIEAVDSFFNECKEIFFGARMFKEMATKYAQSKLVLNRSINGDVNMRVFEALCSGSCLVTDRVPDLAKLGFVDGVHYAGYYGPGDLAQLTRALLDDEPTRERIAAAGRQFVLEKHTYTHRAAALLEKLKLHTQEKKEHACT